ncbi:MAG TPA: thioesterase domain-containing protein, partial [Candidatus Limnocylindria bacterium]|nr:thioesterase domain-containing protein [Candidatus Limnocylindria bacterium]
MVEHSTTFAGAYLPLHFQLKLIWERLMGRPVRDVTWNFFECGGTPELAETMLKEASAETGQQITTAAFLKNPTIAGLADAVLSAADRDELSEVQRGNGEAPFFFLHGDILGGGFYTRGLAEDIGSECPFFSVPMPPVTRESSSTIEEAAARYCAAIRERKARGPYVLGGFSLAALFAYEVARQLSPEGEEVEALVLIDPDLPTAFERLCLRAIDSRKKAESFGAKVDSFTTVYCKLAQLSYVWQSPLREKARFVWR